MDYRAERRPLLTNKIMKTFISAKPLYNYLTANVTVNSVRETQAMAFMLLEHYLRLRNVDVLTDKPINSAIRQPDWDIVIERLNKNEPIQHIIGSANFCGLDFRVSPSVLIPRPETEELVRLIVKDFSDDEKKINIVDIGTGSGCIAIVLDRFLPHAKVSGWDVSDEAISVAKDNARQLLSEATFEKNDILQELDSIQKFDCIVSNPPYITYQEAFAMQPNVLRFEPHLALFVEDNDPLLFYHAIANFSLSALKPDGACYVEINEHFGETTLQLFINKGFKSVVLLQDIHGKDRFVKAQK